MREWPTTCLACRCQSRWHPQAGPGPQGKPVLQVFLGARGHLESRVRLEDKDDQEDKDSPDHEGQRE